MTRATTLEVPRRQLSTKGAGWRRVVPRGPGRALVTQWRRPRPSLAVVPAASAYATSVSSPSRPSFRSAKLPPLTVRVAAVRCIERASGLFRHASRIKEPQRRARRRYQQVVDRHRFEAHVHGALQARIHGDEIVDAVHLDAMPRVEHQRDVRPRTLPRERA